MTGLGIDWATRRRLSACCISLIIFIVACRPPTPVVPDTSTEGPIAPSSTASPATSSDRLGSTTIVHVGQLGTIGEAGQFLALAQGYFAQQGLAIDAVQVDPAKTTAALLSGELDVLGGAAAARLFVTVASN